MTVILLLVLKWLLLFMGAMAVIAVVLLCAVIFLDYHVDRISEKNKDP